MIEVSEIDDAGDELVVLPASSEFEGVLSFSGRVRIDGTLAGRVIADGRLLIDRGARVRGEIEIDELVVAGRVEGTISARRRLEVRAGAEISGELRTPSLQLEEGAFVEGRCNVGAMELAES